MNISKMNIIKLKLLKILHKPNFVLMLLSILLIAVLIITYMIYTATHYNIEFYQVSNNYLKNNMRIVFVSDLHNHEYGKDNERLINDIRALKPDLIISGGDLVIERNDDYSSMLNFCTELSQIAPFYGILGNHEEERIYLRKDKELRKAFENAGLKILANESAKITIKGNEIELIGISGGDKQFDLYGAREFMDNLPKKTADIRICISHVPITFVTKLNGYDFDFGLSGHTHGGLIVIPKLGGLYSSEEKFFPDYYAGLYKADNAEFVISAGLGDSRPIPRINNPHELSVIDLKRY